MIKKGLAGGFVFGLAFAGAHLYLNIRYDLPLYLIMWGVDAAVECAGRGCLPYLLASILASAVFWAFIGALAVKFRAAKAGNDDPDADTTGEGAISDNT